MNMVWHYNVIINYNVRIKLIYLLNLLIYNNTYVR